ncbi:MAG: hypothetical protein J1E95_01610 [Muribaculaceae bacterium]|nr:hypothetical protein [Muribaculaceae bacterium]
MNFIKYTYENGKTTYLPADSTIDVNCYINSHTCVVTLVSRKEDKISTLRVLFLIELANRKDFDLLTEEDYNHILGEFSNNFTEIFEEDLSLDLSIVNLNTIIRSVRQLTSLFARSLVEEKVKNFKF